VFALNLDVEWPRGHLTSPPPVTSFCGGISRIECAPRHHVTSRICGIVFV
jgi:hypothetical protein